MFWCRRDEESNLEETEDQTPRKETAKRVTFALPDDDDEESGDEVTRETGVFSAQTVPAEVKSSFEKRQEKVMGGNVRGFVGRSPAWDLQTAHAPAVILGGMLNYPLKKNKHHIVLLTPQRRPGRWGAADGGKRGSSLGCGAAVNTRCSPPAAFVPGIPFPASWLRGPLPAAGVGAALTVAASEVPSRRLPEEPRRRPCLMPSPVVGKTAARSPDLRR